MIKEWLKNNYIILIVCLAAILICLITLNNIGIERVNCINYYKEYLTNNCECKNSIEGATNEVDYFIWNTT